MLRRPHHPLGSRGEQSPREGCSLGVLQGAKRFPLAALMPRDAEVLGGAASRAEACWDQPVYTEVALCLPLLAAPHQCPLWQAGGPRGDFQRARRGQVRLHCL